MTDKQLENQYSIKFQGKNLPKNYFADLSYYQYFKFQNNIGFNLLKKKKN